LLSSEGETQSDNNSFFSTPSTPEKLWLKDQHAHDGIFPGVAGVDEYPACGK